MKTVTLFAATILSFSQLSAQLNYSKKTQLLFTSYMGKSKVVNSLKDNIDNGFLAMTGIELQFEKHGSVYGEINFDGYNFQKQYGNLSLKNSLNTIALTVGYKYRFSNKKLSPYIKTGLGIANISYPVVDAKSSSTSIENSSKLCIQFQASTGFVYKINKSYGVFADVGFQQYQTQNYLNQNLPLIGFKIGIISSF